MLSYQRIDWKHAPQRDIGQRMLLSSGNRAMQTLSKLPTAVPSMNVQTVQRITGSSYASLSMRTR